MSASHSTGLVFEHPAAPIPSSTASAALPYKQITSFVARVQHEVTALAGHAGASSAQASDLRVELAKLGKDARALAMHPSSSDMDAVNSAVRALRSHAGPLIAEMQAACPNP